MQRTRRNATAALLGALVVVALAPSPKQRPVGPPAPVPVRVAAGHAAGPHIEVSALRPQPDSNAAPHIRPGGYAHRVYLAKLTNEGAFAATDDQLSAAVDQVLERWLVEADGGIASFQRRGGVHAFATDTDCQDGTKMWREAAAVWPNVDFDRNGNHLVVLTPPGCDFGIGTVGKSLASGGEVEVRYDPHYFTQDLMHELGHNFGLQHADARVCAPACRLVHYADHYSFMGASIYGGYTPPALESIVRSQLGIAQTCELPAVQLVSGQPALTATYDVFARTSDTGTRGLRVRDPATGQRYWIDWRSHAGRDALAPYAVASHTALPGTTGTYAAGIVIERRVRPGGDTEVLSYPHGRGVAFAWQPGQQYTTPDGSMAVLVDSIGAHSAHVTVTLTDAHVDGSAQLKTQRGSVLVRGHVRAGETVTAVPQDWTQRSCFRYRWFAGGTPIRGARASTFSVPAALTGAWLSVRVTGQRPGYAPLRAKSEPRLIRNPVTG